MRLGWKMRWKIVSEPLRKTVSPSRLPAQGDKRPVSNRMRLGFSSFRTSERACIKLANNLAAFHRAGVGRATRLFVERPGERTSDGFLTHLRRGKCHTPNLSFQPLHSGNLAVTLPGDLEG